MTSNTHSVQSNIAAVLAVLTKSASALCQKLGQAVSVWPVFPMAQPKERASRRFGIVLAWTAHRIGEITKHSRDFGMHHIAIFPFVRWIRSISTNSKCLLDNSASTPSPLTNARSTIADTDAKQPLDTLLTANPLEAVNRAVAAALDQLGCGGFMRFACRKEEAKA